MRSSDARSFSTRFSTESGARARKSAKVPGAPASLNGKAIPAPPGSTPDRR